MVKVAWKTINGYGPYAYLQKSVWLGNGKVVSKHVAYLGKFASVGTAGGLYPGHHISWEGERVIVPQVDPELKEQLKTSAQTKVVTVEGLLSEGMPPKEITVVVSKKKTGTPPAVTKKQAVSTLAGALKAAGSVKEEAANLAPNSEIVVGTIPLDNKGKPLIKAFHVNHMKNLAAKGDIPALEAFGLTLQGKLLATSKKAAVANVVAELKGQALGKPSMESAGEDNLESIIEDVSQGQQTLPAQTIPSPTIIQQETVKQAQGAKNWDTDFEQIAGKKGSNEGGLFKDKQLQTLHYVKWPSENRARIEVLAGRLYQAAGTPTPQTHLIKMKGQWAVASDWITDVNPLTPWSLSKHKDVRRNFVVDAWLANWDVIGANADNIVTDPSGTAYRVDTGGTMIYRAQGKPKDFPGNTVAELLSMRNPSTAPQAAKVFASLTPAELKAGAKAVAGVSVEQIDAAVDELKPEGSEALKQVLKQRREYIIKEFLAAKPKLTKAQVASLGSLTAKATALLAERHPKLQAHTGGGSVRSNTAKAIMTAELGSAAKATAPLAAIKDNYGEWKGSTAGTGGSMIRWAGAVVDEGKAGGDAEIKVLEQFFTFKKGNTGPQQVSESFKTRRDWQGADLVSGMAVTRRANAVLMSLQHGGQDSITLYRTWQPDQVQFYKWSAAKVGDTLEMPAEVFSHSLKTTVFAHGGLRTKLTVPVKSMLLTDRLNNPGGSYIEEDEILYRMPLKMEVIKT